MIITTIDGFTKTDEQCFGQWIYLQFTNGTIFNAVLWKSETVMALETFTTELITDIRLFVLKSSDDDLRNASASLWSVNAYCNTLIENLELKSGPKVSTTTLNTVKGEALTWKAMTYFYLVRIWGAVPIIHNNSKLISDNQSNSIYKNKIEDVYTYIVKTLRTSNWFVTCWKSARTHR